MMFIHTPQVTGRNDGKPWCEFEGETLLTENEEAVTCPECLKHLRFCREPFGRKAIDWFGEEDEA